jgi:di/tricarboxylate transporter
MAYGSRRLASLLAMRTVAASEVGAAVQERIRALEAMLQAAILLMVVLLLLVVVQPFMNPIDGLALLFAAMALLVAVTWRGTRHIQGHVREASALIAEALSRRGYRRSISHEPVEREIEGLGTLTEIHVPPGSSAVGKTLGELDLHSRTGAMVVAIARHPNAVVTPADDEKIRGGDVLELTGSRESIGIALKFLGEELHGDTPA